MRRVVAIGALLAVGAVALLGTGAGSGDGAYLVRAEFRNASFLVAGEEVRISGVKVGTIQSLAVTPRGHRRQSRWSAAVVLEITRPGFQDFRRDATCTIKPQSLIGEKFVECKPTQPRAPEAPVPPELALITSGEGKGQRHLPVTQTMRPIVGNTLRLPYRQRLSLVLNELGAGLAGRGADLRSIIRSADPALRETDRVLEILARENRALADLARDSDRILAPLARDKERVASFVDRAATVTGAAAERRADLARILQRLPRFLRELRPTMARLGGLADEMTPVVSDLGDVAPDVNRVVAQLGPFSRAATPALGALGDATVEGRRAVAAARPVVRDLRAFATAARPLGANLAALLTSVRDTGGIQRLMDFLFYSVAATNGFDRFGHYLRASLVVNLCSTYAVARNAECSANFAPSEPGAAQASAARASAARAIDYLLADGGR
jgi:virulence factor Mce-like protein